MRLLLDEQHDRQIAVQLRRSGHDVVAVTERGELLGVGDEEVLVAAALERRALVTENVRDLAVIHRRFLDAGRAHFGIVFTAHGRYPRARTGRRRLIAALDRFLRERPAEADLRDQTHWL